MVNSLAGSMDPYTYMRRLQQRQGQGMQPMQGMAPGGFGGLPMANPNNAPMTPPGVTLPPAMPQGTLPGTGGTMMGGFDPRAFMQMMQQQQAQQWAQQQQALASPPVAAAGVPPAEPTGLTGFWKALFRSPFSQ